jgi:hypothetical protein
MEFFSTTSRMLLGINELQAERLDRFTKEHGLDADFQYNEASIADLKGHYVLLWDLYIEHKQLRRNTWDQ